jgi:hypothetical protein
MASKPKTTKQIRESIGVLVNLGKLPRKQADGKTIKQEDIFIVMSKVFADVAGATYSTKTITKKVKVTKGALKGRERTVAVANKASKTKYWLGYADGIDRSGKKPKVRIRWVPLNIPSGISTLDVLKAVLKFKKRPIRFKTPAGVVTRFVKDDAK